MTFRTCLVWKLRPKNTLNNVATSKASTLRGFQRVNVSPFNRTTLTQGHGGRNPLAHGLTVRPGYVVTHQGETRVKNALWRSQYAPINKAKAEKEAKAKLDKYLAKRSSPIRGHDQLGFDVPEVNLYAGAAQWVCSYSPVSSGSRQHLTLSSRTNSIWKPFLDWNRSKIGRFKCFMWRKWTVWSLCEVYVKSSHTGQKWSRWFYWSFYFVNAECKKRLTRINVSKQKSDER